MNILASLEKQSKPVLVFLGILLIGLIGFIDYLIGSELSFSVFYVLPISMVTWFIDRRLGLLASAASAMVWLAADIGAGKNYSFPLIPFWNSFIRFAFFVIITLLLSSLKSSLKLTRTDDLTSAINSRYFYEILQMEIDRIQRHQHPFTVVFFDIDNFKSVNDQFGHVAGDQVLIELVDSIKNIIRKSDFIARLGGDEFAILFPETDQVSARIIFTEIQDVLMEEMPKKSLPITLSAGLLTCLTAPETTDDLMQMADKLMYMAKDNGKNSVKYSIYAGEQSI